MQPTPEQIKKQIEEETKKFDISVNETHEALKTTHEKKEYTFSVTEKRRLAQMQAMALFIKSAIDDILYLSVLPRIGINTTDPEVKMVYDITIGRFTIWEPKSKSPEN